MKISEYTKQERQKLKDSPLKEKLAYYWDYYKWYAIAAAVVLIVVIYSIVAALNQKENVLSGVLIDGKSATETPGILQAFYEEQGIDAETQEVFLQTGLSLSSTAPEVVATSYERIHAGIGAEDTDFLMGYGYAIESFAYDTSYVFTDLRDVFSAETLKKWEDRLYYVDQSLIEKINDSPLEEVTFPDPRKPEEMENPIPVAVMVSDCKEFTSAYYASEQELYIGIVINAPHKEKAVQFIEFLLDGKSK